MICFDAVQQTFKALSENLEDHGKSVANPGFFKSRFAGKKTYGFPHFWTLWIFLGHLRGGIWASFSPLGLSTIVLLKPSQS